MAHLNSTDEMKLAIDGGSPAVTSPSPQWPIANTGIRAAMDTALTDHSWGHYHGPWLDDLCDRLRHYFHCSHVELCSSGTIAVELALRGSGVKQGDEVILAAYDFPGNFRSIEAIGARPVLVDVVADGWVMDVDSIGTATSERTTAVLVSHLHGQIADILSIRKLLNEHGRDDVKIIEDTCQVPGARLDDQPLGSFGDVSALSFGGSKLLSAGRGGATLTDDPRIAQRIKILNDRGNEAYPLSQLQAIVLGPQVEQLDRNNRLRNQNAMQLLKRVESMKTISGMKQHIANVTLSPAFFKVPFLLDRKGWPRERWLQAAHAEGLPVNEGFRGFVNRSERRCRKSNSLEHATTASEQTVVLHHPILRSHSDTILQIVHAFEKLDYAIESDKSRD